MPTRPVISTSIPVSCFVSRTAVIGKGSPMSIPPPGTAQLPLSERWIGCDYTPFSLGPRVSAPVYHFCNVRDSVTMFGSKGAMTMRRVITITLLSVALMVLTVTPADAGGQGAPEFQERYSFFEELHPASFASEICETEVLHEISGKGTFKLYESGLVVDHFNVTETLINPATGDTVIHESAATFRGMGQEVFDEATQTLTITFEDTFVGLPSKFYKPGEGILWRDAGKVTFMGTVVLDVSNPEEPVLISIEETLDIRGPHPELTEDFEVLRSRFCGALGA